MGSNEFQTFLQYNDFSTYEEARVNKELTSDEFRRRIVEYHDESIADLKLLDMGLIMHKTIKIDLYHIRKNGKYLLMVVNGIRFLMITLLFVMSMENYGDIIHVIGCIKSTSAFLQGLAKLLPYYICPENIAYIRLAPIKHFWKSSVRGDQTKNYNFWYKVMRVYQYSIYGTFFALILRSLVTNALLFPVYVPDIPLVFTILCLMQYFQFFFDMIFVVGTDLIFLASCVLIWRQSMLLFDAFTVINGEGGYGNTMQEFIKWVQHHNMLLGYVNCVIDTFKIPLLFQYVISVLGICIEVYIVSQNPPWIDVFASGAFLLVLSFQLGLYCFIADQTSEMVENVAIFINDTKWYNNPIYLNNMLITVICRSQRAVRFTAGGMVNIDKKAFTSIFRTIFSCAALLRQLQEK